MSEVLSLTRWNKKKHAPLFPHSILANKEYGRGCTRWLLKPIVMRFFQDFLVSIILNVDYSISAINTRVKILYVFLFFLLTECILVICWLQCSHPWMRTWHLTVLQKIVAYADPIDFLMQNHNIYNNQLNAKLTSAL